MWSWGRQCPLKSLYQYHCQRQHGEGLLPTGLPRLVFIGYFQNSQKITICKIHLNNQEDPDKTKTAEDAKDHGKATGYKVKQEQEQEQEPEQEQEQEVTCIWRHRGCLPLLAPGCSLGGCRAGYFRTGEGQMEEEDQNSLFQFDLYLVLE